MIIMALGNSFLQPQSPTNAREQMTFYHIGRRSDSRIPGICLMANAQRSLPNETSLVSFGSSGLHLHRKQA